MNLKVGAPLMSALPQQQRLIRKPVHTFQLRQRAFQIQPFVIAPVLPGETLKNALWQARVVTDPIKNALVGWWSEWYLFYCPMRTLPAFATKWENMFLDPEADVSSENVAANTYHYHYATSIDWVKECLTAVVNWYFRDDGETAYGAGMTLDNLPLAQASMTESWLNSIANQADMTAYDMPVDLDASGTVATVMASEVEHALLQYRLIRARGLTNMTYEQWLSTYGERVPEAAELHVPELVRYARSWQYPSNTVDPADGSVASAVSWVIAERADKDRRFKEPGFLFGVHLVRPKVYLSGMKGAIVSALNSAYAWLPAVLINDPRTSLVKFADNTGPLGDITDANGYWVDVRDAFLYGDQFINFALTETDANLVALPTAALQKKYVQDSDVDALFVTPASAQWIKCDGVINFTIASHLQDQTPGVIGT